jgi:hypothetical protein
VVVPVIVMLEAEALVILTALAAVASVPTQKNDVVELKAGLMPLTVALPAESATLPVTTVPPASCVPAQVAVVPQLTMPASGAPVGKVARLCVAETTPASTTSALNTSHWPFFLSLRIFPSLPFVMA